MNCLIYAIIPFLIVFIFYLARLEARKFEKNMNENNFRIHLSITYKLICIIGALVFLSITIYFIFFPDDTAELWIYLGFLSFVVFTLVLLIYCIRWEIKIIDNQIIIRPFIGKNKIYTFGQITKIQIKEGYYINVFIEKKKIFSIFPACIGYYIFYFRIKNNQNNTVFDINEIK